MDSENLTQGNCNARPRDPSRKPCSCCARALSEITQRGLDHLALLGRQRRLRRDGIADREP